MADFGIPELPTQRRKPGLSGLGGDAQAFGPDPGSYSPPPPPPVVAAGPRPPKLPTNLPPNDTGYGSFIDHFLTSLGFTVRPGRVRPGVSPLFLTWLAPQPIGFMKPQRVGLPEDYLFGFTPTELHEAAELFNPDDIGLMIAFKQRRELLHQHLDAISQDLKFAGLSTAELLQQRRITAQLLQGQDPNALVLQAFDRELRRRPLREIVSAADQIRANEPTITDRNPQGPQFGQIVWPEDAAGGFIDALNSLLSPDP